MKRLLAHGAVLALTALLAGCSVVPLVGRRRVNMVSDQQVLALAASEYEKFKQTVPLSANAEAAERVTRVGRRIAAATEQYLTNAGLPGEAAKFQWEFYLFKDSQVNAWCMPGGKIAVFEGILPMVPTDDDLATVLSHEVAHAMAKHANERMSQQQLRNLGGQILGNVLGRSFGSAGRTIGTIAYSAGMKYLVDLPYSRNHEYEADKIGLYLMAMAGYDYTKAVGFWTRMANRSGANTGSSFMSTHPNNLERIKAIEAELPLVRTFIAGGGSAKGAPAPVPERNRQAVTTTETPKTPAKGSVPLQTHY